jgi:hypothetical protein
MNLRQFLSAERDLRRSVGRSIEKVNEITQK